MKLNFLATTVVLLVAFLQRYECRAIESPGAQIDPVQETVPVMERLGEEYYLRVANGRSNSFRSTPTQKTYLGAPPASYSKALKLQLTRRLLEGKVGSIRALIGSIVEPTEESMERGRRSEEPPISLDLTFHLLREMMEMSKAEQMAQQAQNNRRMMELFGK